MNTNELRVSANAIYLSAPEHVADDISRQLKAAANQIDALQDLVIWMTGFGYDHIKHKCDNKPKVKVGDIIRVTKTPPRYEYYSVGDIGVVVAVVDQEHDEVDVDFNGFGNASLYASGIWLVGKNGVFFDYEIVEN